MKNVTIVVTPEEFLGDRPGEVQTTCPFNEACAKYSEMCAKIGLENTIELCYESHSAKLNVAEDPLLGCGAEERWDLELSWEDK